MERRVSGKRYAEREQAGRAAGSTAPMSGKPRPPYQTLATTNRPLPLRSDVTPSKGTTHPDPPVDQGRSAVAESPEAPPFHAASPALEGPAARAASPFGGGRITRFRVWRPAGPASQS